MRDRLFAVQQALSPEAFTREAGQVGLNADEFAQCMSSRKFERHVEANRVEAERYGVMGTPGFFVNGRFFNGLMTLDAFQEVIDEELARVQRPRPSRLRWPDRRLLAGRKGGTVATKKGTSPKRCPL